MTARIRILTEAEWSDRHGSAEVTQGRLTARSTTDYLAFLCPHCGAELRGGLGVGLEGIKVDRATRAPVGLLLRIACRECKFRDFFKIPLDDVGRYRTPKVGKPAHWRQDGSRKKAKR